jgi:MFS family permease
VISPPCYNDILAHFSTVTSLLAAPLADNYGRRMTLRAGACVFTIGGAVQTMCTGYYTMILGRIISGFGVGMLSMIVPIYQVCLLHLPVY